MFFSCKWFDNYAKATVKFCVHDKCNAHKEAMMQWQSHNSPTIAVPMRSEEARIQTI